MPEGVGNSLEPAAPRRAARRVRQPAPESFDPRRGPGGLDVASAEDESASLPDDTAPAGGMAKGAAIIRAAL